MNGHCPDCRQPVHRATHPGNGGDITLDGQPTPLGIWRIDSDQVRRMTFAEGARGEHGHRYHQCPPAEQLTLEIGEAG